MSSTMREMQNERVKKQFSSKWVSKKDIFFYWEYIWKKKGYSLKVLKGQNKF